jgi:hypothetical protein
MQGPPQGLPACAAPTGVRFPRTSLPCHSEDLRGRGAGSAGSTTRLAPRRPGFLSPRTSIVRTAHHRHPPSPAPHVSRHASLRPAAMLTRAGRPAPAAQTCLAHRPGLNPCCTHPAGRVACLLRPSTPPALARLRWTPVPPARAAGPPPHASASTPLLPMALRHRIDSFRLLAGFLLRDVTHDFFLFPRLLERGSTRIDCNRAATSKTPVVNGCSAKAQAGCNPSRP